MADRITFEKPIDGVLHLVEHPHAAHDPAGYNTHIGSEPRTISGVGKPEWRLAFVQVVEKLRIADERVAGHAFETQKQVKGTFTTVVYGFIEPVESALKTAREEVAKAEADRGELIGRYQVLERAQADALKANTEAGKLIERLEESIKHKDEVASQMSKGSRETGMRLRAMETELAAVKAYFGAAEYAKAIATVKRPA